MNDEKFIYNLQKLEKMFPNVNSLNKGQMLKAINKSYATAKRRYDQNIEKDIPKPSKVREFERKGNPTSGYEYDLYDIAIFLTDSNYYWKMIEQRGKY